MQRWQWCPPAPLPAPILSTCCPLPCRCPLALLCPAAHAPAPPQRSSLTPRLPCCPRASPSPALILDTPPACCPPATSRAARFWTAPTMWCWTACCTRCHASAPLTSARTTSGTAATRWWTPGCTTWRPRTGCALTSCGRICSCTVAAGWCLEAGSPLVGLGLATTL